jgi:hypothetical protein
MLEAIKEVLFVFDELETSLAEACDEQLLIFNVSEAVHKFAHDEVHAAAYELLPMGKERLMIHFDIGFALSKHHRKYPEDKVTLFACADQFEKAGVRPPSQRKGRFENRQCLHFSRKKSCIIVCIPACCELH